MELYIGVDGGGSKTEVMAYERQSHQTVVTSGSASNPNTVGKDHALSLIAALIDECIGKLNGTAADVVGLSLCMSGVDRPEQRASLGSWFQGTYKTARVEVANDALAALSAGTQGESGIVLIAGTGSIAVGESWKGKTARAGGYGSLIGDEGGGFDIGRSGLMAAIQFAEGRAQPTSLWHIASAVFQLSQPGELIPAVYHAENPVGIVASFARYVLEAAADDEVAKAIVEGSARSLVRMVLSVRQQLTTEISNHVILAGGLLTQSAVLRNKLREGLQPEYPEAVLNTLSERPSKGALLRAQRLQDSPA